MPSAHSFHFSMAIGLSDTLIFSSRPNKENTEQCYTTGTQSQPKCCKIFAFFQWLVSISFEKAADLQGLSMTSDRPLNLKTFLEN